MTTSVRPRGTLPGEPAVMGPDRAGTGTKAVAPAVPPATPRTPGRMTCLGSRTGHHQARGVHALARIGKWATRTPAYAPPAWTASSGPSPHTHPPPSPGNPGKQPDVNEVDLTLAGRLTFADVARAIDSYYELRGAAPEAVRLLEEQELALRGDLYHYLRDQPAHDRPSRVRTVFGYPVEIR